MNCPRDLPQEKIEIYAVESFHKSETYDPTLRKFWWKQSGNSSA